MDSDWSSAGCGVITSRKEHLEKIDCRKYHLNVIVNIPLALQSKSILVIKKDILPKISLDGMR